MVGVTLAAGALLLPLSRIPDVEALAVAADALLVIALVPLGLQMISGAVSGELRPERRSTHAQRPSAVDRHAGAPMTGGSHRRRRRSRVGAEDDQIVGEMRPASRAPAALPAHSSSRRRADPSVRRVSRRWLGTNRYSRGGVRRREMPPNHTRRGPEGVTLIAGPGSTVGRGVGSREHPVPSCGYPFLTVFMAFVRAPEDFVARLPGDFVARALAAAAWRLGRPLPWRAPPLPVPSMLVATRPWPAWERPTRS